MSSCNICTNDFSDVVKKEILQCGHEMCNECLNTQVCKFGNNLCGFCRKEIFKEERIFKIKIESDRFSEEINIPQTLFVIRLGDLLSNSLKKDEKKEREERNAQTNEEHINILNSLNSIFGVLTPPSFFNIPAPIHGIEHVPPRPPPHREHREISRFSHLDLRQFSRSEETTKKLKLDNVEYTLEKYTKSNSTRGLYCVEINNDGKCGAIQGRGDICKNRKTLKFCGKHSEFTQSE
jgi:hypothetical protein